MHYALTLQVNPSQEPNTHAGLNMCLNHCTTHKYNRGALNVNHKQAIWF